MGKLDDIQVLPSDPTAMSTFESDRNVRVGLVQAAFESATATFDPRDTNLERAIQGIKQAAADGATMVALGEVFLQGYGVVDKTRTSLDRPFATLYPTTPDASDPHVAEMITLANELQVTIAFGCVARGNRMPGDVYNAALVIDPDDGLTGIYRKTHLANWPYLNGIADEHSRYSPGRDLAPVMTKDGPVGLHICYDISFPEVARAQTLMGATYLLNLAAAADGFQAYWKHMMWARAVENMSWYLMVSGIGSNPERGYVGGTRAIAPDGEVVAQLPFDEEGVLVVDVNLDRQFRQRSDMHMFHVRQPEIYGAITDPRPYP